MVDTAATPGPNTRRRKLLTYLAIATGAGIVLWAIWALLFAGRSVETDNAYVGAEVAQVTPLVPGAVAKVLVRETETVKAGQPLVVLDDADQRIAVAQAEAALGQAQRHVSSYFANDQALAGQAAARAADLTRADAQIAAARADLERARIDYDRRMALQSSGAVSAEELTSARAQLTSAQAGLEAAQAARAQAGANSAAAAGARQANAVMIAGSSIDANPEVMAARARLDEARLALERTVIRAPSAGVVTRKSVLAGQRVAVGAPIMAIVPMTAAYVDANFKEVQLEKVRPGQKVVLTSDLYGHGVKFRGTVRGLSGGTGSAFSLIPAQNASGNWIKVIQRVPVRIDIDPRDLAKHPLQVGLSMKAKIDVSGA